MALKKTHTFTFVAVLLFFFIVTELCVAFYEKRQYGILREQVTINATMVQNALISEITSSLNLVLGIVGYVTLSDDIRCDEFKPLAEIILQKSDLIKSIELAPNNIITHVYPTPENKAMIGLNTLKDEKHRAIVMRAMESGNIVIAGPIKLVQGGRAFVALVPIYKGKKKTQYWGTAHVLVDEEKLFRKIKQRTPGSWNWIDYGIKGRDSKGMSGEQFIGDENIFEKQPVLFEIKLYGGSWILAAVPKTGWKGADGSSVVTPVFYIRLLGYGVLLIISFLIASLFRKSTQLSEQALIDPLTNIINRRGFRVVFEKIFLNIKRTKENLYIFFFDLNEFKFVNDTYGHAAGDEVLKTVVKRVKKITRKSDVFSRLGGDEFIFVPVATKDKESIQKISDKIISELSSPISIDGQTVKIGCSIGISVYPDDGDSIETLFKHADQAMYVSKKKKASVATFYSDIKQV